MPGCLALGQRSSFAQATCRGSGQNSRFFGLILMSMVVVLISAPNYWNTWQQQLPEDTPKSFRR